MPRHFPNWLRAYMEWTSVSESPDAFHFWTGVGTIAGALRSCVWIDENIFKYTPNFFLFFVGPPGIAAKSTSIGLGMRLLEKVPEINFGPSSLSWQKLLDIMKASVITVKWEDPPGTAHQRPASPLTVEASELGTFLKLGQEGMVESLIDLWDGKIAKRALMHATLSGGTIAVENPWLHVIGATTPEWLGRHFDEGMIHGGLTSRILFIYGDQKRQLVAYPSRMAKPQDFEEKEKKLVEDLIEISKLRGPFSFTNDAISWGEAWYKNLWATTPPHLASVRFEGYKSRKFTLLHKIAMVLSAAQREDRVIDEKIYTEADALLTSTEHTMLRVFESIGMVDEARWVREVHGVVNAYAKIFPAGMTVEQVYKLLANVMSMKDFNAAIISALQRGILHRVDLGAKPDGTKNWGVRV